MNSCQSAEIISKNIMQVLEILDKNRTAVRKKN